MEQKEDNKMMQKFYDFLRKERHNNADINALAEECDLEKQKKKMIARDNDIIVEKNVPIPKQYFRFDSHPATIKKYPGLPKDIKQFWANLDVGDSFSLFSIYKNNKRIRTATTLKNLFYKLICEEYGFGTGVMTTRKISQDETKIWKIK